MSVIIQGDQLRTLNFGTRVEKSTGTLTVATLPLFTIAGGLVAVTSMVGRVTTAITVAGTTKITHNPTAGTSVDQCTATDLGTTDTAVGEIVVVPMAAGTSLALGARGFAVYPVVMETGQIEQITATGADGAITWMLTYVPLDNGATVVAA